jgi:hypothetical protein
MAAQRRSPGFFRTLRFLAAALPLLCISCAQREVPDWDAFYRNQPKSILVLPVENETTAVEAPRFFMATIARPLIARGYYVFPVEATSEILASEGLTAGAELSNVSPAQFYKYFGAEGILRVTITRWDTTYLLLASTVSVALRYELLDARSGATVWSGTCVAERRSGGGGTGNIIGDLIASAVDAAMTAALTDYVPLAREANWNALAGLTPGEYHPDYLAVKNEHLEEWREYQASKQAQ